MRSNDEINADASITTIFIIIIAASPPLTQKFTTTKSKNGKTEIKESGSMLFLKPPMEIYDTIKEVSIQIIIPAYLQTFKSISSFRITAAKTELNIKTDRTVVRTTLSKYLIIKPLALALLILGIIKSPLKFIYSRGKFFRTKSVFLFF